MRSTMIYLYAIDAAEGMRHTTQKAKSHINPNASVETSSPGTKML
jgi:hypothetical protein